MSLTKNDLNAIRKVVGEEIEDKTEKIIKKKIEELARMVNKGFGDQSKELKTIRKELAIHDFKMTEMVHKAEYYKLEERVCVLERKNGLKV